MIVCLCRGASERKVHEAIGAGACSLADLQRCGIGGDCGSCHADLKKMLAAAERPPLWSSPALQVNFAHEGR